MPLGLPYTLPPSRKRFGETSPELEERRRALARRFAGALPPSREALRRDLAEALA